MVDVKRQALLKHRRLEMFFTVLIKNRQLKNPKKELGKILVKA